MSDRGFRLMTPQERVFWYEHELSEAFTENERKPFAEIVRLIGEGRYELWGLFGPDGRMLGYAGLWMSPDVPLVLLDYLGVTASLRGGGLGAEMLAHLRARGTPLVLESELPVPDGDPADNAIRVRRIAFYRRCGFVPVYEMATCGMHWQAMCINADGIPAAELMRMHRALYGAARSDVCIPIAPDAPAPLPYWMRAKEE